MVSAPRDRRCWSADIIIIPPATILTAPAADLHPARTTAPVFLNKADLSPQSGIKRSTTPLLLRPALIWADNNGIVGAPSGNIEVPSPFTVVPGTAQTATQGVVTLDARQQLGLGGASFGRHGHRQPEQLEV